MLWLSSLVQQIMSGEKQLRGLRDHDLAHDALEGSLHSLRRGHERPDLIHAAALRQLHHHAEAARLHHRQPQPVAPLHAQINQANMLAYSHGCLGVRSMQVGSSNADTRTLQHQKPRKHEGPEMVMCFSSGLMQDREGKRRELISPGST